MEGKGYDNIENRLSNILDDIQAEAGTSYDDFPLDEHTQVSIIYDISYPNGVPVVQLDRVYVENEDGSLNSIAQCIASKIEKALARFNRRLIKCTEEARYEANYERIGGCYAYK